VTKLLAASALAEMFGLPSARTVRTMRMHGLRGVKLGRYWQFDPDDVSTHIAKMKEIRGAHGLGCIPRVNSRDRRQKPPSKD
jgi:hypothetical protein